MTILFKQQQQASSSALPISATIVLSPDLRHVELEIEKHLKQELGLKLDSDQQLCPQHLRHLISSDDSDQQHPPCQLGIHCPFRHVTPSSLNFAPPTTASANNRLNHQHHHHHNHHSSHAKTVCKHWLRGLCKKGNSCEFLHEYNLRTMPECWFFGKYGFCSNGDECMYLHVDERMRVLECMDFRRGFCPKGISSHLNHSPSCLNHNPKLVFFFSFSFKDQAAHKNISEDPSVDYTWPDSVPTKRPAILGGIPSWR